MSEYEDDFKEIGHCGGRVTFIIRHDDDGRRSVAQRIDVGGTAAAAWFGIYALAPHGIPIAGIKMRGIKQLWDPPPPPHCFPVFLGSDLHKCWGHQCPDCDEGYFRNGNHPASHPMTCPYCGLREDAHHFLTPNQKLYVEHYIQTLIEGLRAEIEPGTEHEIVIDMDKIASAGDDQPKPHFYYTAGTSADSISLQPMR